MMHKMTFLRFLVVWSVICGAFGDDRNVQTTYGEVKGRTQPMLNGNFYYAWLSIPYASPPTGSLRFQAPVAPAKWKGVKTTTNDSKACYQVKSDSPRESEDCLYVNVYSPSNYTSAGGLPVIFWIYGGAFRAGSAYFYTGAPDWFIQQGVIVVTHNYRVGPFGFLSTGDKVIPGNAGLKDQAFALKWVHENIAAFGGDPNKIVIAGQSAGSASVGYQLLSPKNKGLFRGAIQESGSPLNEWAFASDPEPYVDSLIQIIDADAKVGNNSLDKLRYLQSVSAKAIDLASKTTHPSLALPVVEPEHEGAFITEKMYQAFEAGNYNQVPVLIGHNSEEDVFILQSNAYVKQKGQGYDSAPLSTIPHNLKTADSNKQALAKQIKAIYLGQDEHFASRRDAVIRLESDGGFTRGIIKQAELMSNHSNVYFYVFSYDGRLGGWSKYVDGAERVSHGEELHYMWVRRAGSSNEDLTKYPEGDQATSHRLIKLWTNFAKYSNPTYEQSETTQGVIWPTFNAADQQFLDIGNELVVKSVPKVSYAGWKKAYESYGTKPYVTY